MAGQRSLSWYHEGPGAVWRRLCLLLGCVFCLVHCGPGGDTGTPPADPDSADLQFVRQGAIEVLNLYRTALVQEDIDRLQALLQPADAQVQSAALRPQRLGQAALTDGQTFLSVMSDAFRTLTITDLQIPAETIQIAADGRSVTFQEVESAEDPTTLTQQTRVFHTTFQLTRAPVGETVVFQIAGVRREGPVVEVTTPGQVVAGVLARVMVNAPSATGPLQQVEVTVPDTGAVQTLAATGPLFHGAFLPPVQSPPQPLRVRLRRGDGTAQVLAHRYQLRMPGEGVVQRIAGTGTTRIFAVAVAPDGFIWAGGDQGATVYRVFSEATTALRVGQLFPENPNGRVEETVVDQLGRVHFLTFASGTGALPADHRDVVLAQGTFCPTVNLADPTQDYPFQVRDLATGTLTPSPSTRAVAAGEGDIWLFGSDGGVARVADTFREGNCPETGVTVRYEPIFRRDTSALPANTVPALVVGTDGTLGFGTALGFTRFQDGQFTPVPFARERAVRGDAATIEAFFQAVAAALFAAQPLTTVRLGDVSFVDLFGAPVIKEDLIFSAVEAAPGRVWLVTLGGGLRRLEAGEDTLLLTRQDGLGSNVILALAVGPDGAVWAATDEGVSRMQTREGQVAITTFSALDGLRLPARDVAVDAAGTAWVATDGGLFRIGPQGEQVQGVVQDPAGRPVSGADVAVPGTPFRTVTDAAGQFVLANLPPGLAQLRVDGHLARGGPFTSTCVALGPSGREPLQGRTTDIQRVAPVAVAPLAVPGPLHLVSSAEDGQTIRVGRQLPLAVAVLDARGTPVASR